jgi:riboflavin synthase
MYTGIVTSGTVVELSGSRLVVSAPSLADCELGASVSINGVCLTVVARDGDACSFDVSEETFARSAIGQVSSGERVNVERPMRAGDEFGGHIVQGHVDAVGAIVSVEPEGDGSRVRVTFPPELGRYIVEKGSVTVDGVSLTVTGLDDTSFGLALIPETLRVTTFGEAKPGRKVNLEVDVLAKYVERIMRRADATHHG